MHINVVPGVCSFIHQRTQKARPEWLRLRRPDRHSERLAHSLAIHSDGDCHGHRDNAPSLPDLHVGRVDPQVLLGPLDRAVQEGVDPLVDLSAQPRHLTFADAAHPHGSDELVH